MVVTFCMDAINKDSPSVPLLLGGSAALVALSGGFKGQNTEETA